MLFLAFAFLFAFANASGLACPHGRDLECLTVTNGLLWVGCVNHVCTCKTQQGFSGAATSSSKCGCPAGHSVYYEGLTPYCVKLSDAVAFDQEQARNTLITGVIHDLYESLVWPAPQAIMGQLISGNTVGGIWDHVAEDAVGRVDPLGEFDEKDGIVEYFYGQVWLGASQVQEVYINTLLVEGNKVTVSVDMHFYIYDTFPGGNLLADYNLTESGVFTFNDDNKIQSMDLIIHNLGKAVNGNFLDHPAELDRVCSIALYVAGCDATLDPDGFFTDYDDCINFLSNIDYGTWDDIRTDSVACRQFHSILAIGRPSVHCVHVGKTGGGKCIPHAYSDYYLVDY